MAELLYRLGAFAAGRAWAVIIAWVLILGVVGAGFAIGFSGLSSSFDVPGTASGAVIEELEEKLPAYSGAAGTVIFSTENGEAFTDEQRASISALVAGAQDLPDVSQVYDPFESQQQLEAQRQQLADGRAQLASGEAQLAAGQAQLDAARAQAEAAGFPTDQLDGQQQKLDASREELAAQTTQLENGAELLGFADGVRTVSEDGSAAIANVAFTLPRLELPQSAKTATIEHFESDPIDGVEIGFSTEIAQGVPQIVGLGEAVGVALAAVMLLVMFGSIIAAAFPIVTALVGVAIGALGTLAFSGIVPMASVTPVLGVMLGLAVGIDYSLFIINRHRKQLEHGAELVGSIGLANGTAGNAVVFAGATVAVALLALNVTGIPFLGLMGTAGAVSVAVAVLIAITLTPALLGLAGARVLGRRARARIAVEPTTPPEPPKPMSSVRAVLTIVGSVIALLIIAIPSLSMRVGLPDGSSEAVDSAAYRAFTVTAEKFGAGANSPLLVTADLPEGLDDAGQLAAQVSVARVLSSQDDVVAVAAVDVSDDGRLAVFQVLPAEGPNAESTDALVRELRSLPPVEGTIALGVAGQAAINIDISEGIAGVLPLYLTVVIGLSLIIMIVVFRSFVVPLIATGGFVLSLFATYGGLVAVFQWGWLSALFGTHDPGPVLSFLPVILVGILFGLAMDYQLFLSTGMREAYVHGASARDAVARGFHAGRSVVIAAGLIMVAVFSGFITSESSIIKSLGFGLALGILLDAFVVRLLLMPALMHLLGRAAWWFPRWLDRILPNVDVEGAALERHHPVVAAEHVVDR